MAHRSLYDGDLFYELGHDEIPEEVASRIRPGPIALVTPEENEQLDAARDERNSLRRKLNDLRVYCEAFNDLHAGEPDPTGHEQELFAARWKQVKTSLHEVELRLDGLCQVFEARRHSAPLNTRPGSRRKELATAPSMEVINERS